MKKKLLFLSLLFTGIAFGQTIALQQFATGFNDLVEITHAGDDRFFVAEQDGLIKILNADGTVDAAPFLNIASVLSTGSERGLLGLAFHPGYESNGFFFVDYTNTSGNTVIARYKRSTANPSVADPSSALILLTISQPFSNHNGGCLRFGPDGYLYIAMGDGGSGGDPGNRAQNKNELLGKLLRIDVDNGSPYSSPASNPFVGTDGADEIWAYGLRNPWKFSFNRTNGDIWIADVGQDTTEEINKAPGTSGGLNYGWRCYEGSGAFNGAGCGAAANYTMPFAQYSQAATNGCSVTGGYVYTGSTYPNMQGKYIFSDYCHNKIGIASQNGTISFTSAFAGNNFTVFGEDINGELYVGGKSSGTIYRVTDTSLSTKDFNASAFTIYPNPASAVVHIRNAGAGASAARVQVIDMSGKLLLNKKMEGQAENTVDTGSFPAGLYMINVTDVQGSTFSYKLSVE